MKIIKVNKHHEITVGSPVWVETVLSSEPFEGDFFDGARLSDKVVLSKGSKKLCNSCYGTCKPGTYNRVMSERDEGQLRNFRFCETCCNSMGFEELFEGDIWIDVDNDDAYDAAVFEDEKGNWLEPVEYWDYTETVSAINRGHLEKVFGRRWQENVPDEKLHEAMLAFEAKGEYHSEWYKRYTEAQGETNES